MRLICPNCGAQYEVPTEVIPESGRDVQCSECSHTWFQHHPDNPPPPEEDGADTTEVDQETLDDTEQDDVEPDPVLDYGVDEEEPPEDPAHTEVTQADDTQAVEDITVGGEAEEDVSAYDDTTDEAPERTRRSLDPGIANVLREEAQREAQVRDQELRGVIETQTELGLEEIDDGAQKRSAEARARMARLRGVAEEVTDEDASFDAHDDIDPASRRNLLPDIEEINSSLTPDTAGDDTPIHPPATDADALAKPRTGFRSGFRLAVVLALLGFLTYVFAPQIAETVPAVAGPLNAFVDTVNSARLALSDMMQNLATSLSSEGSPEG